MARLRSWIYWATAAFLLFSVLTYLAMQLSLRNSAKPFDSVLAKYGPSGLYNRTSPSPARIYPKVLVLTSDGPRSQPRVALRYWIAIPDSLRARTPSEVGTLVYVNDWRESAFYSRPGDRTGEPGRISMVVGSHVKVVRLADRTVQYETSVPTRSLPSTLLTQSGSAQVDDNSYRLDVSKLMSIINSIPMEGK